jgi:hypothetical protein
VTVESSSFFVFRCCRLWFDREGDREGYANSTSLCVVLCSILCTIRTVMFFVLCSQVPVHTGIRTGTTDSS